MLSPQNPRAAVSAPLPELSAAPTGKHPAVTCVRPQHHQEMDLEDVGIDVPDYSDGRRKPSPPCTRP
jgi:hypothetical protein